MQTIVVKQGQNLLDIALIYTDSVNTFFEIAELNNISVYERLSTGQILIVPERSKKNIAQFSSKNELATNVVEDLIEVKPLSGINYWEIEETFEIQ